ncbi:MAG TPA: hypothetical protein VGK30_14740, partial [Candidatus Binatia bacterium]
MPLPWFRRKKPDNEARSERAGETRPDIEVTPVAAPARSGGADGTESSTAAATAAARKRRRGTRGGRNRKKKTAAASNGATATASPADDAPDAEKPAEKRRSPERKTRTSQTRRRSAPKRAPLPKAKRELLISVDAGEKRVAVLEDDRVAEVYLERPERHSIAGNIYLGVVDNVLPGMEAAFVEIGLEKNGFLYVDEIVGPELEGRKGARKIQDLIQRGEKILVQAVKD